MIEIFESRLNIQLPESVRAFYEQYDSLEVGICHEGDCFEIMSLSELTRVSDRSSSQAPEEFIGLGTMISMKGEGEESYLKRDLEPEIYASLNAQYKVLGYYNEENSGYCDRTFCFFDQKGSFGEQLFIHDYYGAWWENLYDTQKANLASFDVLISRWIDRSIRFLLEVQEY